MSKDYNSYESPFCTRYASEEMQYVFSQQKKFGTFRRLWVALARAEMKLGLNITQEQVDQLEANVDNIDFAVAEAREKEVRHDVMSHVYAYGKVCPDAAGVIHLGATSCYVGDNTDIIIMRDAMKIVHRKLVNVLANLAGFAEKYKSMPCLAYTHLQPAQLTTVGKRATLWMNELLMDLEDLEYRMNSQNIDIVAGAFDQDFLASRRCAGLELLQAPIRCAVSIYHPLAEKTALAVEDLYGEDFMLIRRGWNSYLDVMRDELWQLHPQINVVDFDFFSLDEFNRCENSQSVLMTIDAWAGVHPLLKTLPVDWGYKMPYGVLHSPEPSLAVRRFLDAVRLLYC